GSRSVTITVSERNPLPAMVTADGQRETEFAVGDTLTVKKSEHLARFIRIHGNHFYSVLHHKLLGKER
ncbi:MAG: hypothetical protein IKL80_00505, partial [Clostridia bacterium]|nr:hypothetical protein [Clostridia bacterium]